MDNIRTTISPNSPKFLDQLRLRIRQHGLAYRTEQTYVGWVRRFIRFHDKKHPKDMGPTEIENFLTDLANRRFCSVNTQRTALNSIVYMYTKFLGIELGRLEFQPAKAPRRLPVVYSQDEVAAILRQLKGVYRLQVATIRHTHFHLTHQLSLATHAKQVAH